MSLKEQHKFQLQQIFNACIDAVHPSTLLRKWVRLSGNTIHIGEQKFEKGVNFGKLYVIGAGKASASMALELEHILGEIIEEGLVITKYGHALPTQKIIIEEGSHPVPDQQSVLATEKLISLLQHVQEKDLVICLWSGGASALMTDIPNDIDLEDLIRINDLLLSSGADINEMNMVRKHLSVLKGGQLIRYCNHANVVSLILSDVPSDDLSVIASGPTAPDLSSFFDAKLIIDQLQNVPSRVSERIQKGIIGNIIETVDAADPILKKVINWIVGNNTMALDAAKSCAAQLGYDVYLFSKPITGETELEAIQFVEQLMMNSRKNKICLIQGGETTIKITGSGRGGRNQHFALKALQHLKGLMQESNNKPDISLLSAGTDGTDGPTGAAGAFIHSAMDCTMDEIVYHLRNQDSYAFHKKYGNLLITGPTQTNVMDIMIALIN